MFQFHTHRKFLLFLSVASILSNKAYSGQTLAEYLDPKAPLITTKGYWYEITSWAARTHNCDNRPESMACMACSSNVPQFANELGVAPIGVSNNLWFQPEASATCGMCLRVYMPLPMKSVSVIPGSMPYYPNVQEPWAYSTKIAYDEESQMPYFTAIIVEWFDRNQTSGTAITYPAQNKDTGRFGEWEIKYRAVPCPVNGHNLTFEFMDFSKEHPDIVRNEDGWEKPAPSVGTIPKGYSDSLCDNQPGEPCGDIKAASSNRYPLERIKLKVGGYRVPVGAVTIEYDGKKVDMYRVGDNFWQPKQYLKIDDLNIRL